MKLLTLDEAAEVLHVSEGTVRALARREGLPLIRVSARRYLVRQEDLDEWLDGRVVSGGPDPATGQRRATGESRSPFPRLVEDAGKSGSTGRRRPPAANSRPSSVVSLADSQRRKAG